MRISMCMCGKKWKVSNNIFPTLCFCKTNNISPCMCFANQYISHIRQKMSNVLYFEKLKLPISFIIVRASPYVNQLNQLLLINKKKKQSDLLNVLFYNQSLHLNITFIMNLCLKLECIEFRMQKV